MPYRIGARSGRWAHLMILDMGTGTLTDGGKVARLSRQETSVVAIIGEAYPKIATRECLIERIWTDHKPTSPYESLRVVLYTTRMKILEAGIPEVFKTVSGFGLQGIVAVEIVARPAAEKVAIERDVLAEILAFLATHPNRAAARFAARLLPA